VADVHILERSGNSFRVALHIPVPAGVNAAGVPSGAVLVTSGIGAPRRSRMKMAQAAPFSAAEKAAITTSPATVHEVVAAARGLTDWLEPPAPSLRRGGRLSRRPLPRASPGAASRGAKWPCPELRSVRRFGFPRRQPFPADSARRPAASGAQWPFLQIVPTAAHAEPVLPRRRVARPGATSSGASDPAFAPGGGAARNQGAHRALGRLRAARCERRLHRDDGVCRSGDE
jgi:hypothetical protein